MEIKSVIKSQYHASIEMLKSAIVQCPDKLWVDDKFENQFWHIAYHAIFYTHLYIYQIEGNFIPWDKAKENYNFMGPLPWPPFERPQIEEPYTIDEVLEYLEFFQCQIDERIDEINLETESGFSWIPLNKLELQFYNIRHLQSHAGELNERLNAETDFGVEWMGAKPEPSE